MARAFPGLLILTSTQLSLRPVRFSACPDLPLLRPACPPLPRQICLLLTKGMEETLPFTLASVWG